MQKASISFPRNTPWGPFCHHHQCDTSLTHPDLCSFPESLILSLSFPLALTFSLDLCLWLPFPLCILSSVLCSSLYKHATVLSPSKNAPLPFFLMRGDASPAALLPGQTQSTLAELWENPLLSVESELLNLSQTLQLLLLTCSLGLCWRHCQKPVIT